MVKRSSWRLVVPAATALAAFGLVEWQANAAPPLPGTPPAAATAEPARVSDPSPPPEPAAGTGGDPLTTGELARARAAALTPRLAAGARDVTGAAGPEYLSAETAADGATRQAEVYYYDYRADRLVKQVVDLATGRVTGSYSATGMQPPAARREVDAALGLLLAGPFAADLRDGYAAATGRPFAGAADVVVTAHVYRARPADTTGARACGVHRCLQLVAQAGDGPFIDLDHLIIDLSGRSIARLS
ncbi:hypothetical protein [Actinoplanes digitatis]|uniref:hypothetical protein n=1 Tax=Actinoplanes digitatis TaxID=1868 RepID=UPI001EF26B88|nr:hypothetical protein [Actinoplanes digitatis]